MSETPEELPIAVREGIGAQVIAARAAGVPWELLEKKFRQTRPELQKDVLEALDAMLPDTLRRCSGCLFWRPPTATPEQIAAAAESGVDIRGACHRYPAAIAKLGAEFCGEYKPPLPPRRFVETVIERRGR
jgi:hypothetical protein